jgi:hypothetical protein
VRYTVYGLYDGDRLTYVGITMNPAQRRRTHRAFYPREVFKPLVVCDQEYAVELEGKLVAKFQGLRNDPLTVGELGPVGRKLSRNHRRHISEGIKRWHAGRTQ